MKKLETDDVITIMDQFAAERRIYAPNSIYHGQVITGAGNGRDAMHSHTKETLLVIELETKRDFIEFLFEHSEHCNHITQQAAWLEFRKWESKQ
jgi:hypothetical protein